MTVLSDEVQQTYHSISSDPNASAGYLATHLELPGYQHDARSAVQLDYFIGVLENAKRLRLSPAKTTAVVQIAEAVLSSCKEGKGLQEAEKILRSSLLGLCRASPCENDPYLSPDQIAHIAAFFVGDVLGNFRLYAHVFGAEQGHISYEAALTVETPVVPSFDTALSEAEWLQHQSQVEREAEERRKAAEQLLQSQLEEQRLQAIQEEREQAERAWAAQLAQKPATLEEAVEHLVTARLDQEKLKLEEQYQSRQQALQQQITQLQSKLAA